MADRKKYDQSSWGRPFQENGEQGGKSIDERKGGREKRVIIVSSAVLTC